MAKDNVYTHLHMAIKDVEQAIASLSSHIMKAFQLGDHEEVDRLNGIGRQLRSYNEELKQLQTKWTHSFEENIRILAKYETLAETVTTSSGAASTETTERPSGHTIPFHEKDDKTNLRVTLPTGRVIYNEVAAQTFVEAIQALGMDKVKNLGIRVNNHPLISPLKHEKYSQHKLGGYYIMTHSSTKYKKALLEDIAKRLKMSIKVTIVG